MHDGHSGITLTQGREPKMNNGNHLKRQGTFGRWNKSFLATRSADVCTRAPV